MEIRLLIIRCVHVDEHELFFVDKSAEYQNIGYRKNLTYSFTRLSTGFAVLTRGVLPASRKWTLHAPDRIVYNHRIAYYIKLLSAM